MGEGGGGGRWVGGISGMRRGKGRGKVQSTVELVGGHFVSWGLVAMGWWKSVKFRKTYVMV